LALAAAGGDAKPTGTGGNRWKTSVENSGGQFRWKKISVEKFGGEFRASP
jgi:hypothetical protein